MTILALDQATRISGYSIWKDGELVSYGKWEHTADDIALRIYSLCQEIQEQIEKYEVDSVVIENIQMQNGNVETFHKLAWVQGAILLLCKQLKKPCEIMYPNEWRAECNFLKGNSKDRTSQKKIAQDWCLKTYGKKCTQDEADAICIGYAAFHKEANSFDWS